MKFSACDFTNEFGNKIAMVVFEDRNGITVTASGPTSETEHVWTPKEASVLRGLLSDIGVKRDRKRHFVRK